MAYYSLDPSGMATGSKFERHGSEGDLVTGGAGVNPKKIAPYDPSRWA